MIRSFRCTETERIFRRERSRRLPADIQPVALRKLRMLHLAVTIQDLRVPPANRLERLRGDRRGQYSMARKKLDPVHPGEILLEEFLEPLGLSQNRLAIEIGVPARRINEIVLGKRRITADTALRLARFFKMSPQFWLGLQMDYDLDVESDRLAKRLEREVRVYAG